MTFYSPAQPGHEDVMNEEKIIALFDALKQIHATALELLDSPDLPEHAKEKVLVILEGAETALNAQNKESPGT
jgi:hypothetical protein